MMACTIEDTYQSPRILNQYVQQDNAEIVKQLTRIADALSRPTPAAPEGEVTVGRTAFVAAYDVLLTIIPALRPVEAEAITERMLAAMCAARPAPPPEPSAQEPSEELRLLRELRGVLLEIGTADWWQRRRGLNMAAYSYATEEIARLLAALDAAEGGGR